MLAAAAFAVVAVVALPAVAGAGPRVAGPQPKQMVLTPADVGHVSYVEKHGAASAGPIAATRGYRVVFSGLTPGSVQLLTVDETVLLGKSPGAASKWLASYVRSLGTKAAVDRLLAQSSKSYSTSTDSVVIKETVLRARALRAGDAAAEVVFRLGIDDASSVQIGQIYVVVGNNLSAISFNGAMPGLSPTATRELAVAAAKRMRDAAS